MASSPTKVSGVQSPSSLDVSYHLGLVQLLGSYSDEVITMRLQVRIVLEENNNGQK